MKCPLKFNGEKRVSCSCEREACAWWIFDAGSDGKYSGWRCAIAAIFSRQLVPKTNSREAIEKFFMKGEK